MKLSQRVTLLVALGLLSCSAALASSHGTHSADGHSGHADAHSDHANAHSGHADASMAHSDQASVQAYQEVNAQMHQDMAIEFTGDADVDFVKGMIPHHEGAVAMAEVVLKYGQDPAIRALAEEVIAAQKNEIEMMKNWLHERGYH